jgi:hypothetical protein
MDKVASRALLGPWCPLCRFSGEHPASGVGLDRRLTISVIALNAHPSTSYCRKQQLARPGGLVPIARSYRTCLIPFPTRTYTRERAFRRYQRNAHAFQFRSRSRSSQLALVRIRRASNSTTWSEAGADASRRRPQGEMTGSFRTRLDIIAVNVLPGWSGRPIRSPGSRPGDRPGEGGFADRQSREHARRHDSQDSDR